MLKKKILERLDALINLGKELLTTKREIDYVGSVVDHGKLIGFRAASLSLIADLCGQNHPYYLSFYEKVDDRKYYKAVGGIHILEAIKNDVEKDWLLSIKELLSSEIFVSFLEMADHFLEQGYKDPSAVMIGSVLEGHLRLLCEKYEIDLYVTKNGDTYPKKADLLNADLKKKEIYNTLRQKTITAWLDLRNKAAHGHYDEYSLEEVKLMYLGVLEFTSAIN